MTKDERTNAAEKGKEKADDVREVNGERKDGKDAKPAADGKKDEEQKEGTSRGSLNHRVSLSPCLDVSSLMSRSSSNRRA